MEDKTYKKLLKEKTALEKELEFKEEECAKKGISWDDMLKETGSLRLKITSLDQDMRLMQDPTMQFGKNWAGELIPLEIFVKKCEDSQYGEDLEGIGRYATETGVSDIYIYPSDVLDGKYRKDFSHILWLSK